MDLASMQFSVKSGTASRLVPNAVIGRTGNSAFKSTKAGSNPPKYSSLVYSMDNLLEGRVKALHNDEVVYLEIKKENGEMRQAYFNSSTKQLLSDSPPTALLLLLIHMVTSTTIKGVDETQKAFASIIDTMSSGATLSENEYLLLCSCFYEDTKTSSFKDIKYQNTDIPTKEIEQAARAGTLNEVELDIPMRDTFEKIKYQKAVHRKQKEENEEESKKFYSECKQGKYEIGFNWTASQQEKIPSMGMLKRYVFTEAYAKLVNVTYRRIQNVLERIDIGKEGREAIGDDFLNAILVGKPGTGKTVTVEALAATLGLPLYTVPVTKHSEEDVFYGMTKAVAGGFSFMTTPFLEAYENGGIIVIEEFNLADPGVIQGAIGQALVPPFLMLKDGYEPVYRHPMCVVVMTMNTGTQGSREPNEALASRAPLTLLMEDPEKKTFLDILKSKGASAKVANSIHKAYTKILKHLEENSSEDMMLSVTMRHCIEAVCLIQLGSDPKEAVNDTLVSTLAIKDLEISRQVRETVVDVMTFS